MDSVERSSTVCLKFKIAHNDDTVCLSKVSVPDLENVPLSDVNLDNLKTALLGHFEMWEIPIYDLKIRELEDATTLFIPGNTYCLTITPL